MKKYLLLPIVAILLFIYSCQDENPAQPQDNTIEVSGQLLDNLGNPIYNTEITAYLDPNYSKDSDTKQADVFAVDTTDENGNFSLSNIPIEIQSVLIDIDNSDFEGGLKLEDIIEDIDAEQKSVVIPRKEECEAILTFLFVDDAGNTIENVKVFLSREDKELRKKVAENGEAVFEEVCPGEYVYEINKEGYESKQEEIVVDAESQEISIALTEEETNEECCDNTLTISPMNEEEERISGVTVELYKKDEKIEQYLIGEDNLKLEELCNTVYTLKLSAEGYEPLIESFEFECSETREFAPKMKSKKQQDTCCEGTAKIKLEDENGNVIKGAEVILKTDGKENRKKESNGDGVVEFEELCEGEYTVVVEKEGYERQEWTFEIDCNEDYETEKEVPTDDEEECCDGVLNIKIKDKDGNNIEKGKVTIWQKGEKLKEVEFEDGEVKIEELCEGAYGVDVQAEGYETEEFEIEIDCDEESNKEVVLEDKDDDCCEGTAKIKLEDENGNPVDSAYVLLKRDGKEAKTVVTNSDGVAEFEELCEGDYTVVVEATGFERQEWTFEIDCDGEYNTEKELKQEEDECCDGVLNIKIKDEDGNNIEKGKVTLWKNGKKVKEVEFEDGEVSLKELCEGGYGVGVQAEGYSGKEFEIEVDCDEESNKEVVLEAEEDECCEAVLNIKIKDEDGNNIEKGKVTLWKEGKKVREVEFEDGEISLKELCEGGYGVGVQAEGYDGKEFEIEVDCDEEANKEVTLSSEDECCNGVAYIYIKDQNGDPVGGAKVLLKKDGKAIEDPRTGENGKTVIDGLCEGSYTVVVTKEGGETIEWSFEVECDKEYEFVKELEMEEDCCNSTLQFKVTDKNGDAIQGAVVKIWKDGKVINEAESNSDGWVKIEEFCEGTYGADITHDNYEDIEFEFEIGCDEEKTIEKSLEADDNCCDSEVKFKVKDEDGEGIAGAVVKIWKDGKVVKELETNSEGEAEIEKFCKGGYGVDIIHEDYKNIEFEFEIGCDEVKTIDKTLEDDTCCEAFIRTVVIDKETEDAIEGATVKYYLKDDKVAEGTTNSDGKFAEDGLCTGEYVIVIEKDGYKTIEVEWNIETCKEHQETFRLEKE